MMKDRIQAQAKYKDQLTGEQKPQEGEYGLRPSMEKREKTIKISINITDETVTSW